MKPKIIFCFVFTHLLTLISLGQPGTDIHKMIVGNWKYDIAYDTIGVVATVDAIETNNNFPMFVSQLKIKKKEATLFEGPKKLKCTWEVFNNQITFCFDNGKSNTYQITSLTLNSLELKELGKHGSTLGYKKK